MQLHDQPAQCRRQLALAVCLADAAIAAAATIGIAQTRKATKAASAATAATATSSSSVSSSHSSSSHGFFTAAACAPTIAAAAIGCGGCRLRKMPEQEVLAHPRRGDDALQHAVEEARVAQVAQTAHRRWRQQPTWTTG